MDIKINETEKKVNVTIDGKLFTSYIYPDNVKKPVLWPLMSDAGNMLTRSYPMVNKAGDRTDHPHHVGVWLNYGDVNGLDFWNNSEAITPERSHMFGTIYHRSIERTLCEEGHANLVVRCDWNTPGDTTLLEEETSFDFYVDREYRIIDRETTLKAVVDTVKFIDNKEGMFAIRVARELELPTEKPAKLMDSHGNITQVENMDNTYVKGNFRSSEGFEGGKVWGTRARWMKLNSEVNGEEVAIIIIDHPENVGYPTYWHARDYGLFAANTLGQKIFSNGETVMNFSLLKGESVTFKYRLVVVSKNVSDEDINALADIYSKI